MASLKRDDNHVPVLGGVLDDGSNTVYPVQIDAATGRLKVTATVVGGVLSGYSGYSGLSGYSGMGYSGYSGYSGLDGAASLSGYSGLNGTSGYSGYSGSNGTNGTSGTNGASGYSGTNGTNGASGYSGISGTNGTNGASGYSGTNGTSGYSGYSGVGTSGYSGFSGISGISGAGGSFSVTGAIMSYAGATAPTGWLICDGATISQTTYADLFAVTGHTFGADPGGGNFIIPNLKGKVIVGINASETEFDVRGETGGEKTHALSTTELAAHTHTIQGGGGTTGSYTQQVDNAGNLSQNTGSTGSGTAHNNLQPYMAVHYIIKF